MTIHAALIVSPRLVASIAKPAAPSRDTAAQMTAESDFGMEVEITPARDSSNPPVFRFSGPRRRLRQTVSARALASSASSLYLREIPANTLSASAAGAPPVPR